jgi:integrase
MRHNQRGLEFKRDLEAAGLAQFRLHDCRHRAATLMPTQRAPALTVCQILGLKNATETLNRYSHVLPDYQAEAAQMLDALSF